MGTVSDIQCNDCGRAGDDVAPCSWRGNKPYCPRCVDRCGICKNPTDRLGFGTINGGGPVSIYLCGNCWQDFVKRTPSALKFRGTVAPGVCVVCNGSGAAEVEFKDGSIGLVCPDCGNPNAKRPRGRPPRFVQTRFRMAGMEHPASQGLGMISGGNRTTTKVCRRTAVNRRYAEEVMDLFRPFDENDDVQRLPCDENLSWLLSDEALANGRRLTILIELGRVLLNYSNSERHVREWAEILSRDKPKTHTAVALIRRWRLHGRSTIRPVLGKHPADQGDAVGLALILIRAVERYQTRYPQTTINQIVGALQNAADAFSENDDEQPDT